MGKKMKKILKIIGIILLVIIFLFAGLVVYRIFFDKGPEYFFTIEECEEALVGEWFDPNGEQESYVFRSDKTGHILGKDITWEISSRADKGRGFEHAVFMVDYYFSGSEESDGTLYFDYYDEWDTVIYDWGLGDDDFEQQLYCRRFKTDSVEIVELNADNWEKYFEVAGEPEWFEYDGKMSWLGYTHYLYLRPEYVDRYVEFNYKQQYVYQCTIRCNEVPYDAMVDLDDVTCTILKPNDEVESELKEYNVTYEINWTRDLEHNLRADGAARLTDFETDHEGYASEGQSEVTYDIMEDIEVVDATGVLVFFK